MDRGDRSVFIFPNQMILGGQTLIMILFALSLDLILGYAGIVTLGHAAYFGLGAYAAALLITDLHWSEPFSGLACARRRGGDRRIFVRLDPAALSRPGTFSADAVDHHHAPAVR